MSNGILPQRLVDWLFARRHTPQTVCIIEPDEARATRWILEVIRLIEDRKADMYSRTLKDGQITIQWVYGEAEQKINVFRSYTDACEYAFDSVARAGHFNEGGLNV